MKNLSLKQIKMVIKGTRQEILRLKKERDHQEFYDCKIRIMDKIWIQKRIIKSLKKDALALVA